MPRLAGWSGGRSVRRWRAKRSRIGLGLVGDPLRRAQLLYLALLPLAAIMIVRLSAATHADLTAAEMTSEWQKA